MTFIWERQYHGSTGRLGKSEQIFTVTRETQSASPLPESTISLAWVIGGQWCVARSYARVINAITGSYLETGFGQLVILTSSLVQYSGCLRR
ncbi:hypothetical protein [Endozoicomonas sp. ONNA2]|uniref:hypothetical protein n=1 Tax=Endozoicomonas sp. ONNA2 TaxID=2828741 RepID=UPI0021477067|nr:hypothetical protein [Endozoicomonas sp. ONNA2]